jgi:hypothetical protein
MMFISEAAMHEAAHAVVAAYLRIPFSYVTIRPRVLGGLKTGGHVQLRRRNHPATVPESEAIMALAARVEIALHSWDGEIPEESYIDDEAKLIALSKGMGIADSDFRAWRDALFQRAREIVAIPYVSNAIEAVTNALEYKKRIFQAEVRAVLGMYKAAHSMAHVELTHCSAPSTSSPTGAKLARTGG